jgi:hypothetical protein
VFTLIDPADARSAFKLRLMTPPMSWPSTRKDSQYDKYRPRLAGSGYASAMAPSALLWSVGA